MICKCCNKKIKGHKWWSEKFKKKTENYKIVCKLCYDIYWQPYSLREMVKNDLQ